MNSPKTRPTVQQRWPRGAESQRRQIHGVAEDARELVREALKALDKGNPDLVRVSIAFLDSALADIQRLAVEARIGPEAPSQEGHSDD